MSSGAQPAAPRRPWLTRNVLALGVVSLLTDAASEMVIPLLPAFVVGLGGGALALGWIEGLADLVAAVLRLFAGRLADRFGRSRPLVLAGYGLSAAVRPLFALAGAAWHVAAVRSVDRVGKGLRGSPRDTLLAASVPASHRGRAFGFHRGMDHLGAAIGPLLAFAVLTLWTDDVRTVFWLTAVPGVLAVAAVLFLVHDEPRPATAQAAAADRQPRRELAAFLVPLSLFTLGKASDVFLLLLASAQRAPLVELPLLWIALHVVRTLAATPGGWIADRFGQRLAIGLGWMVHAGVFAGLAFADSQAAVRVLFVCYGLQSGLSEAGEKALVARIAPAKRWGTAFGWYHLAVGVMTLAANVGFGWLWEAAGRSAAFLTSAALALVATVALGVVATRRPSR